MKTIPAISVAALTLGAFLATTVVGCKPPPRLGGGTIGMAPGGGGSSDASPITQAMPEAANTSAPNDIQPGTRLVYYTTTASFDGNGSTWEEDPNGQFIHPKTGKRIRQIKQRGYTGASAGYNVYEVVALDGGTAAIATSTYGILDNVAPRTINFSGTVAPSSSGGGLWANPDILQRIPDRSGEDRIVHMPYKLGERNLDALWIDSRIAGHELHVYDMVSGVMIHLASSGSGSDPELRFPSDGTTPTTMMADSTIANIRKIVTPWAGDAAPEWAQNLKKLEFTGNEVLGLPGAPQNIVVAVSMRMTVQNRGNGWIMVTVENHRDGGPGGHNSDSTNNLVTGNSNLNPLWIGTSTLAGLRQGQAIDHDELLKVDTVVGPTENLNRGPAIAISRISPIEQHDWFYDLKTGMLVQIRVTNRSTYVTTTESLANVES